MRGWSQCGINNYHFTRDNFTYRIPIWQPHLKELIDREEVNALEICSYQGMSTCWLLDNVLTSSSSKLVCIEPQMIDVLEDNLAKTGKQDRTTFLIGKTHPHLASLTPDSFDLISIQDKCKLTDHAYKNAQLTWQLSKIGGLIIFNDYGWGNRANPKQNPKQGIERFLDSLEKNQWQLVNHAPQANQFMIRKLK